MKFIDVNNLTTINEALQALENVGASIEQIKLQLEFPEGRSSDWGYKARYALKKKQGIRTAICNRLAILRQIEKEKNNAQRRTHAELMIKEMGRYLPKSIFLACNHRAKLKVEAANG